MGQKLIFSNLIYVFRGLNVVYMCQCPKDEILLTISYCNTSVTGSTKTGHDYRFDFSSQTQSFMNTLSNFDKNVQHCLMHGPL